jgi:hypothetical protein
LFENDVDHIRLSDQTAKYINFQWDMYIHVCAYITNLPMFSEFIAETESKEDFFRLTLTRIQYRYR